MYHVRSHGDGSLHETLTLLLAWGAGIVKPSHSSDKPGKQIEKLPSLTGEFLRSTNTKDIDSKLDNFELPVHNYGVKRHIVQQADICPLIAGLLGAPIPANSVVS
ncbi:unnamed protein product [Protopolystoma xenopodis]|uniref:GPI ethanolamine phosphate transferase 1 n=1 Tax=Protopolystoma xenopodis TaxID=117903 RepID=A0A3S5C227_9PLAT|nr:unnamed protein product [Protopolystoma xenopodis]